MNILTRLRRLFTEPVESDAPEPTPKKKREAVLRYTARPFGHTGAWVVMDGSRAVAEPISGPQAERRARDRAALLNLNETIRRAHSWTLTQGDACTDIPRN